MSHSAFPFCLVGLTLIAAMLVALRLLVALSGARLRLRRLVRLHGNQTGSVQSLSFVMTLPLFIMIMMGIVEVSQLMIAKIFVEYAAAAAARSAVVWLPATIADDQEGPNQISDVAIDPQQDDSSGGTYYLVTPTSQKALRIQMAAAQALMPIAPSRDTQAGSDHSNPGFVANDTIQQVYSSLAPGTSGDASVSRRLANKLAYSLRNTVVQIRIFHPGSEPDLTTYDIADDLGEFYPNEIGWQDAITVQVTHRVALLPGPARMFANFFNQPGPSGDASPSPLVEDADTIMWPLTATATLGNEGQKPLIRYDHASTGLPL